jgi:hypothetical protein
MAWIVFIFPEEAVLKAKLKHLQPLEIDSNLLKRLVNMHLS